MEGEPRLSKISPESEEYKRGRKFDKDRWTHWNVFGKAAVSKQEFIERLENKDTAKYALDLLREGLPHVDITPEMFPIWKEFMDGLLESLSLAYQPGTVQSERVKGVSNAVRSLPAEIWRKMLAVHVDKFEQKLEKFGERIPELMASFEDKVLNAIEEKRLPISPELLKERIQQTAVVLDDALYATLEEYSGQFDVGTGFVAISEDVPDKQLEKVFTHEMFHVLSGRTAVLERDRTDPEWATTTKHQRVGTRFAAYDAMTPRRFRWLNEALTEGLTIQLLGEETSNSYRDERQLLALLLKRGKKPIPQELFVNAYFENYEPDQAAPIPAWKALVSAIDDAYEPGFLLTLDKFVQSDGVKAATDFIKTDWRLLSWRVHTKNMPRVAI